MDVSKISKYAKAVVSVGGAVVATATCFADGVLSGQDINLIITAWGVVLAVYFVPNKK